MFAQLPMFQRIGPTAFRKDLGRTLAFCEYLGNPERNFPSIHIAGTNGKGSTAHMLSAIFTAAGLRVGLYTSPHYLDFRERVKLNGQPIPKKAVVSFVEKHRAFSEKLSPSFFEWATVLAFDYFSSEKVDIAIIETGLGGRLDSTNVIQPVVSVITNISFDHQQFLGDTLPLIAGEKAGIIKPNTPVVIGETHPETAPVFLEKAEAMHAPIVFADQHFTATPTSQSGNHTHFQVQKNNAGYLNDLVVNHLGDYQRKNVCTVLQTLEVLPEGFLPEIKNASQGEKAVREGLFHLKKLAYFMGRWEYLSETPRVLCDSAHNEDGIRWAVESLSKLDFDRLHFVFGMVSDKSPDQVLSLLPKNAAYYFAKANIPRGLDAEQLRQTAAKFGLNGRAYRSVRRALAAAKKTAAANDLVFVGGSIFTVAEVMEKGRY